MKALVHELASLLKPLPKDAVPPSCPSSSYREVVSLQAVFVTLIIALMVYVQKDPAFHANVDGLFVVLASIPLLGLFQIMRGHVHTPQGDLFLCAQPVRAYARQALVLNLVIVVLILALHLRGQLPGQ